MIYGTVVASFFVDGKPVPQGSKNQSSSGHMYEAAKGLYAWRKHIAAIGRENYDGDILTGPMLARCSFVMYRPKNTPKTKPTPPAIKKPDTDKCARAVLDALTGVVWRDDAQVTKLESEKRIAEIGEPMGVHISVIALSEGSAMELSEAA